MDDMRYLTTSNFPSPWPSSIYLSLSLSFLFSLSRSFVCKQPGLRIRDRMRFEFHCSCYRCLAEFIPSFKTIKNVTSNITEIPTPGFTTPLLISEQSLSYKTSCPSGLPCVRNPESKGKAGGPWTHRWHGPTKTHLCRRENVPASEMARWPSQKPPMPTCHDMT